MVDTVGFSAIPRQAQDLSPHIAEDPELNGTGAPGLVEQLQHSINTGSLKFNAFTKDQKHNISLYASAQHILRANIRYNPTVDINLRFSYAESFRAPQAFDEDLHISNVGGERVSIVRSPDLKSGAPTKRT